VPAHHTYEQLTLDLERVMQAIKTEFGDRPTAGIFHSMSGRTAMKHALEIGWRWEALVLVDPPNMPPPDHPAFPPMAAFEKRLTAWARSRRRRFASVAELTEEYKQSRATARWVEGAHELMARSVLRRSPDGEGYELVCAPENEAAIYAQAMTLNLWPNADEFDGPVKLIGCDPQVKGGPAIAAANAALGREGGYDYTFVAHTGHLLQIEKPQDCVAVTMDFLGDCGLA
jgi:pimeloyl-ACP methyl ester carboxylesterase